MNLVDDDASEVRKEFVCMVGRNEQGELFGRGEQDIRRIGALALALRLRRVARAGLDADVEAHFGNGGIEVALHIGGEGFQRRDVERVQGRASGVRLRLPLQFNQACQEPRQRLAAARGGDEEGTVTRQRRLCQRELVWTRRPPPPLEPVLEPVR